jgi:type I restriction enzyme S subunit
LYFFKSYQKYKDDLRKLKISFPSLPEQQKISSFLSSVDKKIEKIKEKKKNIEEYKK